MEGQSYCCAPEIQLAMALGCSIEIKHGLVIPTNDSDRPFLPFIKDSIAKRNTAEDDLEKAFWKESTNSCYGKTAQGLRDKRTYNLKEKTTERTHPSEITNPFYAAQITSLVRAVSRRDLYVIVGFDTEYQPLEKSFTAESVKSKKAQYDVLSYQFHAVNNLGQEWNGIIVPEHEQRMPLTDFIIYALAKGAELGHAISSNVVLVGHFNKADVPAFQDRKKLFFHFKNIRNSLVSLGHPVPIRVSVNGKETFEINIHLRDSILLAPAGYKSILRLGKLINLEKVQLAKDPGEERDRKGCMRLVRDYDWDLFRKYAIRDAEVCAKYFIRVAAQYKAVTGKDTFPVALSTIGMKLLLKDWKSRNVDQFQVLGRETIKEVIYSEKHDQFLHRTTRPYLEEIALFEQLATECYHGGRNEQMWFGPSFVAHWNDYDLASAYGTIPAPPKLSEEMEALVKFKTDPLPPIGQRRYSRWLPATSQAVVRQFGNVFGALAAAPFSQAAGYGLALPKLTFGLFVFPAVLNWYLDWSEKRKGFFTHTETSLLYQVKAAVRNPTGWIRQNPQLAESLRPIEGLVSPRDIAVARRDWSAACDKAFIFVCDRIIELLRVGRKHRDPFVAILPVISSEKPLREYKKIADEIVRLMPNKDKEPIEEAVAIRAYLMLRMAIHLGARQRNLRELLLCEIGNRPLSPQKLETMRCGEMRWIKDAAGWEVFIPAAAFKNSKSSFFRGRPLVVNLPNLDGLYDWIERYIVRCRPLLLNGCKDPGTFFVKWVRHPGISPELDGMHFYATWKSMIRRYGIYNPYTKRGAIPGLLPHGPHCVRDILATHILKETNSYELAGFAIQDTIQAVMRHYARFLPHEKAARAAEVINKVWEPLTSIDVPESIISNSERVPLLT